MIRRWIVFFVYVAIAGGLYYALVLYGTTTVDRAFRSFVSLAVLYLLFRIGAYHLFETRVKDVKSRYRFRKSTEIVFYAVLLIVLLRIWVEDPQTLLVSYGLVAAGATIALQDLFKNFAGGIILILNNIYRVGDRIEIEGLIGDVVDVGLLNTTLMEIGEWVAGNQTTGRIVTLPNGVVISKPVKNFTKDHDFVWDEVSIPITYDSDWKRAAEAFREAAGEITEATAGRAERQLKRISAKYYYIERETRPTTYVVPTDNWVSIQVRYIADARSRRGMRNEILRAILAIVEASKDIEIASSTFEVVGMPEIITRQKR